MVLANSDTQLQCSGCTQIHSPMKLGLLVKLVTEFLMNCLVFVSLHTMSTEALFPSGVDNSGAISLQRYLCSL